MPSPRNKTTLVILLGASSWTSHKDFPGSQAFSNAACDFKQYCLHPDSFGLLPKNLLDLFDTKRPSVAILQKMSRWIRKRLEALKKEGITADALIFYFVGHADFAQNGNLYCLVVRSSSREYLELAGIPTRLLLETLTKAASELSQILILDCCYAASAYQRQALNTNSAVERTLRKNVDEVGNRSGPGTYFLCSSGKDVESLIMQDGSYPLFSKALLKVLSTGDVQCLNQPYLSINDIAGLTEKVLQEMSEDEIRIPEYSSINRQRGDVANIPFFPNPAYTIAPFQDQDSLILHIRPRRKLSDLLHYLRDTAARQITYILSGKDRRPAADLRALSFSAEALGKEISIFSSNPKHFRLAKDGIKVIPYIDRKQENSKATVGTFTPPQKNSYELFTNIHSIERVEFLHQQLIVARTTLIKALEARQLIVARTTLIRVLKAHLLIVARTMLIKTLEANTTTYISMTRLITARIALIRTLEVYQLVVAKTTLIRTLEAYQLVAARITLIRTLEAYQQIADEAALNKVGISPFGAL